MKPNKTDIPTWDEFFAISVPEWYRDSKFGIYMHWGVYSVPAFSTGRASSDKYSMAMYIPLPSEKRFAGIHEHHLAQYGDPHKFGYKDYIPLPPYNKNDEDDIFDEAIDSINKSVKYEETNNYTKIFPLYEHALIGFIMAYNKCLSNSKKSKIFKNIE